MDIQMLSIARALHIFTAALWLGAGALLTLYVMPSIRQSGAAGVTVIAASMRRGLGAFMASVAGLTIVSGALLYWSWFQGRGGAVVNAAGVMLTLGALAGFGAAVVGGAILGRTSHELATLAEAPPDAAVQNRMAALHRRGAVASRVALTLLVSATLLMVFSRSF